MTHTRKFDKSVSLLCWAYNEEELIGEYLERAVELLSASVDDFEIVLIDDGSVDETYEIAKRFQEKDSRLRVYRNERNMDVGYSSLRAISLAQKEYLFWQTVDWAYDISGLREYLELLKQFDIVYGTRRAPVKVKTTFFKPFAFILKLFGVKHLTKRSDTVPKAIISIINYSVIRLLFRLPLSDYQNIGFYPTKWIQSKTFEARSSFANPEILLKAHWDGLSIKEVAINFLARKKGHSKGTRMPAIINAVKDIFRLWFQWVVLGRGPMRNKGIISRLDEIIPEGALFKQISDVE